MTRVVTVSATYGAGGAIIAPLLARRLDLPFADRLTPMGGKRPTTRGVEGVTEEERRAEPRSALAEGLVLLSTAWSMPTPRDTEDLPEQFRARVEQDIESLVAGGGAVILGRAGSVVLAGRPGVFHVRLDGPEDRRARRGAAWEGVSLDAARDRLREADSMRAKYTKRLYRRDQNDASLYHLILDSTAMGAEASVEVIAAAAEAAWRHDDATLESDVERMRGEMKDVLDEHR